MVFTITHPESMLSVADRIFTDCITAAFNKKLFYELRVTENSMNEKITENNTTFWKMNELHLTNQWVTSNKVDE